MHRQGIHTKTAIIGLLVVLALLSRNEASAGPITGGFGNPPFTKLGVYQGVISVVPGGAGDSILEIGNAGRDIASTGSLYLRPGTNQAVQITPQDTTNEGGQLQLQGAGSFQLWAVDVWQNRFRVHSNGIEHIVVDGAAGGSVYIPTGSLCFGGVGSTDCKNSWSGLGGGATPTLDAVLGAGNSGNAKKILLNNQAANTQSFGASSTSALGTGSFAFLAPNLNIGAYSDVTRASDSGLFFSSAAGLTIGGWNTTGKIKGVRLSGGTVGNAAVAVNNGLAGTGSGGDGLAVYTDSVNSSIYSQQSNAAGYAGYFTGGSTAVYAQATGNGYSGFFASPVKITGTPIAGGLLNVVPDQTNPAASSNITIYSAGETNSTDGGDVTTLNLSAGSQAASTVGGRAIGLYINATPAGTQSKPRYAAYFDGPVVQYGLIIPKMMRGSASSSSTCNAMCSGAGMFCLLAWPNGGSASEGACSTNTTLMRCMCGDKGSDGINMGGF